MTAIARDKDRVPLCPRCGARLGMERRRLTHRLLSLVYPVRLYLCADGCPWRGLVASLSGRERRKQQVRVLLLSALLVASAAAAILKFGSGLLWSPSAAPAGDGVEEGNGSEVE